MHLMLPWKLRLQPARDMQRWLSLLVFVAQEMLPGTMQTTDMHGSTSVHLTLEDLADLPPSQGQADPPPLQHWAKSAGCPWRM